MGLDSVEILQRIEKHFAIAIPDSEAEKADTVGEIFEMVMRHLSPGVDMDKVYREVVYIIADQTGIDEDQIQPHHSFTNDLGID